MVQFSVNTTRFDPYKNFKFRVKWDGKYVAGISKVSPLIRRTEIVEHRDGGEPSTERRSPGQTEFDVVTLERGVTHDPAFEAWANRVWNMDGGLGAGASPRDMRKDIRIELYNEAGQVVLAYTLYRAWPTVYQALPELDADGSIIAIELLVLAHEGWERDYDVREPLEP
jgi:phage tail-like protein